MTAEQLKSRRNDFIKKEMILTFTSNSNNNLDILMKPLVTIVTYK